MSWSSLEVAKLAVAISTPLTVLAVGWWIRQREQINAELIRKRIAIYDEVVPKANDILCFYLAVGHWRDLDPAKVIECKRELDRLMYRYRPFWSKDCWHHYSTFADACFEPFAAGAGRSALLRLDAAHLRTMIGERFDPAWEKVISSRPTPTREVRQGLRRVGGPASAGDRRTAGQWSGRTLSRSCAAARSNPDAQAGRGDSGLSTKNPPNAPLTSPWNGPSQTPVERNRSRGG
jgi:hypothetical protein